MSVDLMLIQVTDINMSIHTLVTGSRNACVMTVGVGRASWFGTVLHHHKSTNMIEDAVVRYIDQVLQPIVLPFLNAQPGNRHIKPKQRTKKLNYRRLSTEGLFLFRNAISRERSTVCSSNAERFNHEGRRPLILTRFCLKNEKYKCWTILMHSE